MRLMKSVKLNAEQLRDVLDFIANNQNEEGHVQWTDNILFRYVPKVFEGATVPHKTATNIINTAISKSFFDISLQDLVFTSQPKRLAYQLFWDSAKPAVPEVLRNTSTLLLTERQPETINAQAVQVGSEIVSRESFSVRLDDRESKGTLGFIATVENLNSARSRHVIATAGHLINVASSIYALDDADQRRYLLQVVPEFRRTLGTPSFRIFRTPTRGTISANEICLLETNNIPLSSLSCSFPSVDCAF
ncbi:hypothetical protein AJ79_09743 [Helicocarpus griseus UAMH5409]|uniref:Uncharacterized protein n=1 Tax=Helicocarpus griseus UAMH5409 TaxID=1447875 RepID=A0A2B7WH35_9EURO|nr:hypothetical protein AJ79_09743 [Helicocarpus griseus UAMH5409]